MVTRMVGNGYDLRPRRRAWWWVIPLVLLTILVTSCLWLNQAMTPTVGHSVTASQSPVEGLPADATHIDYYLRGAFGPVSEYEFDVPEASFLAWAKAKGWTLKPLADAEVSLSVQLRPAPHHVTIRRGYEYEWIDPHQSDHREVVRYDADRGRVYYEYSTR